ncbi:MAG: hypothetical protein V3S81_10185 [Anaerolineales bacterium]
MPIFESTEKMYEVLGTLFQVLADDPTVGPKYRASNIVIKFTISDPDGFIWLDKDAGVICGPADLKPTIEMTLSGDTCHQFWLQSISMPVAMAKGRIKAKGPLPKVLKLLPMLKPAYAAYPEIARKHGLPV